MKQSLANGEAIMDALLQETISAQISVIVGKMLQKRGVSAASPEQNLRDAGLSSLDMVNLMLSVEGEFDIFIPQEAMTPENFRTIKSIETLVIALKSNV